MISTDGFHDTRILEIRRQTLVERLGETHGSGKFVLLSEARWVGSKIWPGEPTLPTDFVDS